MIKLPATRLLPMTICVITAVLALKSFSLGRVALANDSPLTPVQARAETQAERPASPPPAATGVRDTAALPPAVRTAAPATEPSDWPLLQELRARRQSLEEREHALDLREQAVQAATRTLQTQLSDLRSLKSKLETLEAARRQRSDAGWTGIVKVYEAMRPADAAAIFDALDPRLLVQILDRMNERKAALVMGSMDPERARLATQMLAAYRQRRDADPLVTATPADLPTSPGAG